MSHITCLYLDADLQTATPSKDMSFMIGVIVKALVSLMAYVFAMFFFEGRGVGNAFEGIFGNI